MSMEHVDEIEEKLNIEYASMPSNTSEYNSIYADLAEMVRLAKEQHQEIERQKDRKFLYMYQRNEKQERIDELRIALRVYADPKHYEIPIVQKDGGETARKALGENQ